MIYFMNIDRTTREYVLVATNVYGATKNDVTTETNSKQLDRTEKYKLQVTLWVYININIIESKFAPVLN